jgi:hypothetical protein
VKLIIISACSYVKYPFEFLPSFFLLGDSPSPCQHRSHAPASRHNPAAAACFGASAMTSSETIVRDNPSALANLRWRRLRK